ncbi:MAG: family 16 glycosylhydrolase [Candidatus Thorarchaeota archaeon]
MLSTLTLSATILVNFYPNNLQPSPYLYQEYWKVTFQDDFNDFNLNFNYWSYNYPINWPNEGHTHNHQAYMTNENILFENGLLRILAENRRHPDAPDPEWGWGKLLTYNYTSGAIHTQGKYNFTSGYIEGRFKMPTSRGFWPAFWMLKDAAIGLPEIDILEVLTHQPRILYTTVHYGYSWSDYSSFGWMSTNLPDLSADFHTYGVEVAKDKLTWFFDGEKIGRVFKNDYWLKECKDLFIIINLAIGGWELNPNETTNWPAYYECDWIKIWEYSE